jgi:hypothetical protein
MTSDTSASSWSAGRPWGRVAIVFGIVALVGLAVFLIGTAVSAAEYTAEGADAAAGDAPVSGPLLITTILGPGLMGVGVVGGAVAFAAYLLKARRASGAPR